MDIDKRNRVRKEYEKQARAQASMKAGAMPKRTARRIIERSRQRIAMIVTGG